MHLTSNSIDWYAARAGGVVAYVLLTAVVLLGLSMSSRQRLDRWPRFALEDVHRFGGLLVGAFLVIHIGTIAIDSYLPFSLTSLAVPLVSSYRPLWTALGIVSAELLIALAITNHYRDRIGRRLWRRAHYLNFVVWGAATAHGLGSGTDRSTLWLLTIEAIAVACVCGATAWRALGQRATGTARRGGAIAAAAVAPVLIVALGVGPLHSRTRTWNAIAFRDVLTGQIVRDNGVTRGIASLAGSGSGKQRVLVRADLLISPRGLLSTAFQMEYLPSGALCRGNVTQVRGYSFEATCRLSGGQRRFVHAEWHAGEDTQLGGIVSAHA
jgi:methionine sulfoxide reductase heme-binding subunit